METGAVLMSPYVTLPLVEAIILIAALVCCLLVGATKTGLIVTYIFSYRWGWILLPDNMIILFFYLLFGISVCALTVISMFQASD